MMKMGNIVPRVEFEPTSLAFRTTVLPFHHVSSLKWPLYPWPPVYAATCLRGHCRLLHMLCIIYIYIQYMPFVLGMLYPIYSIPRWNAISRVCDICDTRYRGIYNPYILKICIVYELVKDNYYTHIYIYYLIMITASTSFENGKFCA